MARSWLSRLRTFIMKRTRRHRAVVVTHYVLSDEDDEDDNIVQRRRPCPSTAADTHTHIEWIHGDDRTRTQTMYCTLPSPPRQRPRSHSSPVLPALSLVNGSSNFEPTTGVTDLDYLYRQIEQLGEDSRPRKRTAGDRPLLQWIPEANTYLAELLRLEGRGDFTGSVCACGTPGSTPTYRCEDCSDRHLYCQACIVAAHARHPLHRIKRWHQDHFTNVSLKSLGLIVQLGHEPGDHCINPTSAWGNDFVVLDVFGIHRINLQYCACESAVPLHLQLLRARFFPATSINPKTAATFHLLESFHLLSTQSKVSAFEFYTALSRRTDNTGVFTPQDRYPAFLVMIREWRHLKMMKRAGRSHDPGGISATSEGSCAVVCPACPQPGKNLPADWRSAPPKRSWLYRLFLAIDANFRLKRKKVSSDTMDPSLNHGCAYMVEEKAYKAHLAAYDDLPVENSEHCNSHDAVKLATLKGAAGLAVSGVVSVDCARHDMKCPASTGDLAKGERFVNVDYMLYSSLQQNTPKDITVSYDIACHLDRNIDHRFTTYGFDVSDHELEWVIPKFHISAHRDHCRANYNLHNLPYSARTDGEGIERGWSKSNPAASSTKEMGPGSRRDLLDDIFSDHNWSKISNLAKSLLRKIKKAVPERNTQVAAFEQYNAALPLASTTKWRAAVEAWEGDWSQPNPFFIRRPDITQAVIKRRMTEEDAEELRTGMAVVLHEKFSASGTIIAGIELEDHQCRLQTDLTALSQHATDLQHARMQERQNVFCRRFDAWAEIQQLYMPGIAALRARLDNSTASAGLPHRIPLLLPSAAVKHIACPTSVMEYEWRLRYAQAFDSLSDLRGHLEVRSHLYKVKDRFVRGQHANTRAQSVIKQVDTKINADTERYRAAHDALKVLGPRLAKSSWEHQLKPLLATDIRHVTEGEDGQSEGRRTLSWIWQASASPENLHTAEGPVHESLQESLRVEWCKARTRAARWTEEVDLLQEEMRRTIAYHEWEARRWADFVDKAFTDRPDYSEGANAYARRQSATRESMREFCQKAWQDVRKWVLLGEEDENESIPALQPLDDSESEGGEDGELGGD